MSSPCHKALASGGLRRAKSYISTAPLLIPWPKSLDQPQQHARTGIGVGRLDMRGRGVADAAAAAHDQQGDI